MTASASLHRNLFLLSQLVQPSDDFLKHFREGMFDKPNTGGFLHVSHYLLTIYDPERFKKLVEWPVICKKTEAKYRNNVKDYLMIISTENPDISFPNILLSHLIHAGGNKFTTIMWKSSKVAMRKYIARETSYNIIFAPQPGVPGNLGTKFLQGINAKHRLDIMTHHTNIVDMEKIAQNAIEKENEELNNTRTKIFEVDQSIAELASKADVHLSHQKYLVDTNNEEVIQMWKKDIKRKISYIERKISSLQIIEEISCKINNIISNNSDGNILDGKQLQKVNCSEISDLLSPSDQCLLFQLYKNETLVLHNFFALINSLLIQYYQQLKVNNVFDITKYLSDVDVRCEDMKKALTIFQKYSSDITKMTSEIQKDLCHKSVELHDETMPPIMNNAVLMSSPIIRIDTNCNNEDNGLQKRLQFTPVEAAHKSLFWRYERSKENETLHKSRSKEHLLQSRINFDDTVSTIDSEKPSTNMHATAQKSLSSFKRGEKYSRLFSTRSKRHSVAANLSIMSIPHSSKANSTAIVNLMEGIHDIPELSLNISTTSLCSISTEFNVPEKANVKEENKSDNASETEDVINTLPAKLTVPDTQKRVDVTEAAETIQKRRSIGDLVGRYKKFLDNHNRSPSSTVINYVKCEKEEL